MEAKKRLLELDALRGIAAISVVLFHINCSYTLFNSAVARGIFKFGLTGVNLFFIISGFVILLTLEKTKTWHDFAFRRFIRLFPSYWVCVTITSLTLIIYFAATHQAYAFILRAYLPNLTMVQHYFNVKDIDDVYWTLLLELIFYLFMAIVFAAKQLKNVEYIALALMLPIFIYSSSYFQTHFASTHHLLINALPIINYFPLFVMGIIYYRMKQHKPTIYRYAALLLCIACQLTLYGNGLNSDQFLSFKDYVLITALYNGLFLLYVYDKLKFIVNRATLFTGNISYPLYLIHYYISVSVIIPALLHLKVPLLAAAAVACITCFILAALISKYIEKPAMRIHRKHKALLKDGVQPFLSKYMID